MDSSNSGRDKIAIIGSGVSAIGALWALHEYGDCDVEIIEAADRLGGHTNTTEFVGQNGATVNVDMGFIAYNEETYPTFAAFVRQLNLETHETDMSLGISSDNGAFEWAGTSISGVLAQPSNLLKPLFWRMIFDIIRFNYTVTDVLKPGPFVLPRYYTLEEWLSFQHYSVAFRDYYLLPMIGSTWCTPPRLFASVCSGQMLIRFLWAHHLLESFSNPLKWFTFRGGARRYVERAVHLARPEVHLNSKVKYATPALDHNGVYLQLEDDTVRHYKAVVITTSAPEASRMTAHADKRLKRVLSEFKTITNECILHSDMSLMPKRVAAHASWNYTTTGASLEKVLDERVSVTFDMNKLQMIPRDEFGPVLVSMNPDRQPDPNTVQARCEYEHPLYSVEAVDAQNELKEFQGRDGICFAGAWTGFGFHEDGFLSGRRAAHVILDGKMPAEAVGEVYTRGQYPTYGWSVSAVKAVIYAVQRVLNLLT